MVRVNPATLLCAALLLASLSVENASFSNYLTQVPRNAHRHPMLGDAREEILPGVEIVEVVLDKGSIKENRVRSRDGRYEAFTSFPVFRIYFVARRAGKVYEVRGLPLDYRPFSDLVWVNNRTLVFDRWSQPHYGVHYVVDVRRKKLVMAAVFPDQFYLDQQSPKAHRKKQ